MMDLLFADGAAWFSVPGLIGTGFFVIRLVLMFAGHHDGGLDAHDPGHSGDSSHDFQVFSIQSLGAFVMGFGWGGLAARQGMDWTWPVSILIGVASGAAMIYLLAIMLKGMYALQATGNVPLTDTVGVEGQVYVSLPGPGQGMGKVRLVVNSRQRIFNAVASEPLATHQRVRVLAANPDNSLTVAPV